MEKKFLNLAIFLLTLALAGPSGAFVRATATGMTAQAAASESTGGLPVENIIFQGEAVAANDQMSKATYFVEIDTANGDVFDCSATLIARDILLTAAHCIHADGLAMLVKYYSTAQKNFVTVRIDKARRHELAAVKNPQDPEGPVRHDIALLHLAEPITDGVVASLPKGSFKIANGQKVLVAGYGLNGLTAPTDAELMTRPAVANLLAQLDAAGVSPGEYAREKNEIFSYARLHPLLVSALPVTLQSKADDGVRPMMATIGLHSICPGDSGGPSYMRTAAGGLVVVGVHSTSDNSSCSPHGLFWSKEYTGEDTYVAGYADWINTTMQYLHGH